MAAQTYWVYLKKGRVKCQIAGVQSETAVDETHFQAETYRDEFSTPKSTVVDTVTPAVYEGSVVELASGPTANFNNPPTTPWATSNAILSLLTGSPATSSVFYSLDDRVSHIAPRHLEKKRTRIKLWSGLAGAGDLLAAFWMDEVIYYGIGEPSGV